MIKSLFRFFGLTIRRVSPSSDEGSLIATVIDKFEISNVLDIGANIGQFGKELRKNGYRGKIISFEPLVSAHSELLSTAQSDHNWQVYPRCALGGEEKICSFHVSENSVSSSLLKVNNIHLAAAPNSRIVSNEQVEMKKLSSVMSELQLFNEKTLLKLDVQGAEYEILEEMGGRLAQFDAIITELSIVTLYEDQKTWLDVKRKIEDRGFKLWSVISGFTDNETGRSLQIDMIFVNKRLFEIFE